MQRLRLSGAAFLKGTFMPQISEIFFASDFDHTLTGPDNAVRPRNVEAIRAFQARGGVFTVASGRSVALYRNRAASVPVNAPCILFNGAVCYDFSAERLVYLKPAGAALQRAAEYLKATAPEFYLELQSADTHCVLSESTWRNEFMQREGVKPIYCTGTPPELPWVKLVACSTCGGPTDAVTPEEHARIAALMERVQAFCGDACYVTRSLPRVVEIGRSGVDKGKAARAMAAELNRPVLACAGDGLNDLPMLLEADLAFIPRDCDPVLRGRGFIEVASCDEGCIADALSRLMA